MPEGSNACFTARNASYSAGPNIFSVNGPRTIPSPCSPDSAPPNSSTRAAPPAARARRGKVPLERIDARREIVRRIAVHLDAQQRAGIGDQNAAAQRVERRALLRVIEDEAVHHLDRRRPMLQDERRRAERVEQIDELDG